MVGDKRKGDGNDMEMPEYILKQRPLRKPKTQRSNLLYNASQEDLKLVNNLSKKNRGLSNLTYKRVFGED